MKKHILSSISVYILLTITQFSVAQQKNNPKIEKQITNLLHLEE
jgi:hypothetical protein